MCCRDFQVGLDAAGKTTILYKLKLGEIVTTIPTIGKQRRPWCGGVRAAACRAARCRPISAGKDWMPVSLVNSDCALASCCRLQRGDGRVQEHQLHSVGCGRPGQDPPSVAPLLPEHTGDHHSAKLGPASRACAPGGSACRKCFIAVLPLADPLLANAFRASSSWWTATTATASARPAMSCTAC